MVKRILKDMMHNPNKISEEQITAYTLPLQMSGGKNSFIKTLQNSDDRQLEELSHHYQDIKVPILIIWGENDRLMPLSYQQRLTQTFPQAQNLIIPNCGHIPQEECPQEVYHAIQDFYKKNLSMKRTTIKL
jgi:pimeloyl-ACP methyl ester carboxylesterase